MQKSWKEDQEDIGIDTNVSQEEDKVVVFGQPPETTILEESWKELEEKGFTPIVANTMFKNPHDEEYKNEEESRTVLDVGMSCLVIHDLSKLPPLPEPRFRDRRQERNVGISFVLTIILVCIGVTHGISLEAIGGIEKSTTVWWIFLIAIYMEAGIACILLGALLLSDSGVVHRSEETIYPIPIQCEDWIKAYLEGNVHDDVQPPTERYITPSDPNQLGDSYCVRCLVWRRRQESKSYFHCNVCQRCVRHYDHHCSVFGRCIGGKGLWNGNYRFFISLIGFGVLGCLTSAICLLWSASLRFHPLLAVPMACILLFMIYRIVKTRSFARGCTIC